VVGANFSKNEINSFLLENGKEISFDKYIICAGISSVKICRLLNLKIPI